MFRHYNSFIAHTFKKKENVPLDSNAVMKYAKKLGLAIPKGALSQENYFKNKETANPIKEKINIIINQVILESNGMTFEDVNATTQGYAKDTKDPSTGQTIVGSVGPPYKVHVGKGNNGYIVKRLFK